MQDDAAAARCGKCGAWTLVPKRLRNVQDLVHFCLHCQPVLMEALDTLSRLTATQGGAAHEAQTAASPATGRTAHTYLNPQAVEKGCV